MTLWLVCDASGSMIEGGKRLIIRGLVRQVEQYFRLGYATRVEMRLVAWRDHATPLVWNPGDEVPGELLDCRGSVGGAEIVSLLGRDPDDRYLLLTDGFCRDDTAEYLARWRDSLSPNALRIVKVGADSNPKMKGDAVFTAEHLLEAFDGWLPR